MVAALAATVLAQGKTFESPQGFRLKLPRSAFEETRDPKDRIVLGKSQAWIEAMKMW